MYGIEEEKLAEHSLEAQGKKSSGCDKECVCQKSCCLSLIKTEEK